MKRALLVAGIVVAVGWLVWPKDDEGIVLGTWWGKTTQGRPLMMIIEDGPEGVEITEWSIGLDITCPKSGDELRGRLGARFPIAIHDRAFRLHVAAGSIFIDWNGMFTTPKTAEGVASLAIPALVGEAFDALEGEVCKVGAVGFTARPGDGGGAEEAAAAAGRDFEILVDRDGRARIARP